jgi:hypothetical protein
MTRIQFKTDVSNNATKIFDRDEFIGYLIKDNEGYLYNPEPTLTLKSKWFAKVDDFIEYAEYRNY